MMITTESAYQMLHRFLVLITFVNRHLNPRERELFRKKIRTPFQIELVNNTTPIFKICDILAFAKFLNWLNMTLRA